MDEILTGITGIAVGIGIGYTVMEIGSYLYSRYDPAACISTKIRNGKGEFEPVIKIPKRKHGMIISDNSDKRIEEIDKNTIDLVYNTLLKRGFNYDDIYLMEWMEKPSIDLRCNILPSDTAHLREVMENLYRQISPEDTFFMCFLNHGGKTGWLLPVGESTVQLGKGTVKERELEELLYDIHPDHSILYFNNCYSGGFAERLGTGRSIAISTSSANKLTFGYKGGELGCKYGDFLSGFTLFFYSALRNQMPNGELLQLKDMSIGEAFDYASQRSYFAKGFKRRGFFKNTPHLIYGNVNPQEVIL